MTPDELLERANWDFFWVPSDVRVVDKPELLYTCCDRDDLVMNGVVRSPSDDRAEAAADEVSEAHRRVRSRWMVTPSNRGAALSRAMARVGFEPGGEHDAFTVDTTTYVPRPSAGITVLPVDRMDRLHDLYAVTNLAFGREVNRSDEHLALELRQCTGAATRVHRFVAYDANGQPISSAGLTTFPDLRFGLLWMGGTIPSARGRGAYSAVVAARVALARTVGLERVGLYARLESSAPIVASQGFERHGRMQYFVRGANSA